MVERNEYVMEDPEEAVRLDIKMDAEAVRKQALMCGIFPGARVLDAGCGSGKASSVFHSLTQPGGQVIGIDFSQARIDFAKSHYENEGTHFHLMDLRSSLEEIGSFDFIWMRFVLEHYLNGATDIIKNVASSLKPDGIMCLLDLDYNCLSHYPMTGDMDKTLHKLVERMMEKHNFDPFVGRKMYSYMYDLGFRDIQIHMAPHHLIYGELKDVDDFNWIKKIQMASRKAHDLFENYPGGYDAFFHDFNTFFHDPRRFTYTPLIICTGKKPL